MHQEIADLCERVGADVQKDCRVLVRTAHEAEASLSIVETVVEVNDARKRRMADKIIVACGGTLVGALLGLTFKPNTDDMRGAPSVEILPRLAGAAP
jgi:UDPglucose 6-dehydrogenase